MIHYAVPYSSDQNFFQAILHEFNKIDDPEDWLVIMDGDVMFLQSDFGDQLDEYTRLYPDTGMFTCYASRCSYHYQVPDGVDQGNPNILYHKMISDKCKELSHGKIIELNTRIAGHLMMIQKKTWVAVLPNLTDRINRKGKKVLGVDTQITWSVIHSGRKVRLMKGVYVLHYFRMLEGRNYKRHLR